MTEEIPASRVHRQVVVDFIYIQNSDCSVDDGIDRMQSTGKLQDSSIEDLCLFPQARRAECPYRCRQCAQAVRHPDKVGRRWTVGALWEGVVQPDAYLAGDAEFSMDTVGDDDMVVSRSVRPRSCAAEGVPDTICR